ncbi:MAG: hypothetical protein U0O24_07640 [Eggerthellaceae bacterium]
MSLVLSHTTALRLYCSPSITSLLPYYNPHHPCPQPQQRIPLNRCSPPTSMDVQLFFELFPSLNDQPIEAMVAHSNSRRFHKQVRYNVSTHAPKVLSINPWILITSAENNFIQMADQLSILDLITLGFEYCGTYFSQSTLSAHSGNPSSSIASAKTAKTAKMTKTQPMQCDPSSISRNSTSTRQPRNSRAPTHRAFTSTSKIDATIKQLQPHRIKGLPLARTALKYIINDSASPRESALALMLTLPKRLGGYGLPKPILNYRVDIPQNKRHQFSSRYCVCDLYWPQAQIALEYDSDAFHTGSGKIALDSARRDALALLGIQVLSVTNLQIKLATEMDRIARAIGRALGVRIRTDTDYDYHKRKALLRQHLLR